MPKIRQLSATVITQIAAGEVIERPASVVKELVENSLDAGATRIDVELEAGGTELIRVVDDGCGMDADDLPLSIASHATSKLKDADDLFRIATLGFRGEALASICGVAKVKIQSRTATSSEGNELSCDGGILSEMRPWGGAVGTRIEVRHLFFNVPARKKFLKTVATELRTTSETITRLSLAHPNVSFGLKHNLRTVIDIPSVSTLPDRIELFFGREIRRAILEVNDTASSKPDLNAPRVTGYICDPAVDRGNASLQYLFINGRWFRDRSLGHAFSEAYRGLIMTGRYPVGFIYLTVPPESVDVNVHPTKSEVRFRDSAAMYSLIRGSVKQRLLQANLIPSVSIPQGIPTDSVSDTPRRDYSDRVVAPWETSVEVREDPTLPFKFPTPQNITPSFKIPEPEVVRRIEPTPPASFQSRAVQPRSLDESVQRVDQSTQSNHAQPNTQAETASTTAPTPAPSPLPIPEKNSSAFQMHDAYLVLETSEGMLLIDQHALHERILFEQLRTRIRDGQLEIQRLLVPEPVELPPIQAAAVLEAKEDLLKLGLEVSDFGGNTILLSSYPSLLSRKKPRDILLAVVDQLVNNEQPPAKEQLLHLLLATMACKAAVKAGDPLSQEEIQYLLKLRDLAEDSHHCPHGRPTSLLFSRSELDRQFKRT